MKQYFICFIFLVFKNISSFCQPHTDDLRIDTILINKLISAIDSDGIPDVTTAVAPVIPEVSAAKIKKDNTCMMLHELSEEVDTITHDSWAIQIGAFKIKEYAEGFQKMLEKELGKDVRITIAGEYYRVRILDLPSQEEVEENIAKLEKLGFKELWIIHLMPIQQERDLITKEDSLAKIREPLFEQEIPLKAAEQAELQSDTSRLRSSAIAPRADAIPINKLKSAINFDGIPDEEAWNTVNPVKLTMHQPVFGKEPTENTDVRIAYDDKYLYTGASLYYYDSGMIRSVSLKRDFTGAGGDWLVIFLDTYNDKENSMMFGTSPDGLRFDATVQKDAVVFMPDDMPMNLSWNTFWDVLTKRDSNGWYAEFRIPLSSLRFQEINGEVRMGLTVYRWIPAKNEVDLFPAIPPNWGPLSLMKPSQAQEVVFRGIKPARPLYIAPYALGGYESIYELNDEGTSYLKSNKPDFEAGLDLKYGISKTLVMDITVNTDFAQVEADDQQINLTRYSLYFPEKRTFFLERASVFDFSLGGNSNLFYSRRIGLSDDPEPEPVRIYGGARITGRIKKWDVGFLNMQTAPIREKGLTGNSILRLPSENFGVMRFRRQVINENSYVGAMATSRLGTDGSYNIAYGLDGIFRVFGNDYLDVRWSQVFEHDVKNESLKEPTFFMASWERRSTKGLGYDLAYTQSGIHFNPGSGFEMMDDYRVLRGGISYGWISPEKSKLYSHGPEMIAMYRTYIEDGAFMNFTNFSGWSFQTKNQWQANLFLVYNIDNLKDSLEISKDVLYIKPGKFEYLSTMGIGSTPMSKPLYLILMTEIGQYYDGNRFSFRLQPTWNISKHFELGGTYNFDHVNVSKRNVSMTNHIIGIKALYMLDTRLSINAFIQYNTALHGIITNLRLRYNPKEGNDLYLVFDEGRNTDLYREIPNLPVYSSRAVMVKYTYTFNL